MKLEEKYAATSDKEADKEGKKVISDDAYAVCEFLERLIRELGFRGAGW